MNYENKYYSYLKKNVQIGGELLCGREKQLPENKTYDICGIISAHAAYSHGNGLIHIPANIDVMTVVSRGQVQDDADEISKERYVEYFREGTMKSTNDKCYALYNEDFIKTYTKGVHCGGTYMEELTLNFNVSFENGTFGYSGILVNKDIPMYIKKKSLYSTDTWITKSLEGNETTILNTETLIDKIKNPPYRAEYTLSYILSLISKKYFDKRCLFLLYTCRSRNDTRIIQNEEDDMGRIERIASDNYFRRETTFDDPVKNPDPINTSVVIINEFVDSLTNKSIIYSGPKPDNALRLILERKKSIMHTMFYDICKIFLIQPTINYIDKLRTRAELIFNITHEINESLYAKILNNVNEINMIDTHGEMCNYLYQLKKKVEYIRELINKIINSHRIGFADRQYILTIAQNVKSQSKDKTSEIISLFSLLTFCEKKK